MKGRRCLTSAKTWPMVVNNGLPVGILMACFSMPCAYTKGKDFYFDSFVSFLSLSLSFSPLFCAYTKWWTTLTICWDESGQTG